MSAVGYKANPKPSKSTPTVKTGTRPILSDKEPKGFISRMVTISLTTPRFPETRPC